MQRITFDGTFVGIGKKMPVKTPKLHKLAEGRDRAGNRTFAPRCNIRNQFKIKYLLADDESQVTCSTCHKFIQLDSEKGREL